MPCPSSERALEMLGTVFEGARPVLYLVYARGLYLCLTIIVIVHLGLGLGFR